MKDESNINENYDILNNANFLELTNVFLKFNGVLDLIFLKDEPIINKENLSENKRFNYIFILVLDNYESKSIERNIRYGLQKFFDSSEFKIYTLIQEELFSPNFLYREQVFLKGYSLCHKKYFYSLIGFNSYVLFKYDLFMLNDSDRMQFYYSLYGRKKEGGVLKEKRSIKLSNSLILVPICFENFFENFFKEKEILFIKIPILLPEKIKEHYDSKMLSIP